MLMPRLDVLDALVHDGRFALRVFRRQTGWTLVAVATLALGIGANTAMFSVLNGMLLHPLPYPDADRIAIISIKPRGAAAGTFAFAPGADELFTWRAQAHSIEALQVYAFRRGQTLAQPDGSVVTLQTAMITPTFAAFAGQRPVLGRGFSSADSAAGAPKVVVLSEHFWRARFAGDPHVLGTTLTVDDSAYDIVGVMPDALTLPLPGAFQSPDLWLPLNLVWAHGGMTVARLLPGVTLLQPAHELTVLRARAHPS